MPLPPPRQQPMPDPLLRITDLVTTFRTEAGRLRAVDGVSLEIPRGGKLGLIGESGCGKSVTALSILRLIPDPPGRIESGEIIFDGINLLELPLSRMRQIRGNRISMIFQEPQSSLNPVYTAGNQIAEAIRLHQKVSRAEARARTIDALRQVGIPDPERRVDEYPNQMSGGMCQRVMIAMALSCHPQLLIADEPSTALDVTIQAQILELINQLVRGLNMSLLLITHDLGVIAETVEQVAVMYTGKVVESAEVKELFANPLHPYTAGLLRSLPKLGRDQEKQGRPRLQAIPGLVPSPLDLPPGCPYQDRCPLVKPHCREEMPALEEKRPGHWARCFESC